MVVPGFCQVEGTLNSYPESQRCEAFACVVWKRFSRGKNLRYIQLFTRDRVRPIGTNFVDISFHRVSCILEMSGKCRQIRAHSVLLVAPG